MLPDFYPELVARVRERLVPDAAHPGCLVFPQREGRHARIKLNGRLFSPHRVVLAAKIGRELARLEYSCHRCDNPPCANEDHLFLGSPSDNAADAFKKGRMAPPSQAHKRALSDEQVLELRRLSRSGLGPRRLAKLFGIGKGTADEIARGTTYRHVPMVSAS